MKKYADSITELVGNTPLLKLNAYMREYSLEGNVFAKLEYFNPAGSVKDRVALAMIEDAEKEGKIKPGATIIEPTSGNTGIGLALIASAKGYKTIITLPETMSVERRNILKAYGAQIVLTSAFEGMRGAINKARELNETIPGSIILGQFDNMSNPRAHLKTTGPEIWNQLSEKVDYFVAGVGTGGTISGVGAYLKEQNPKVKIIAVEPAGSPFLSKGKVGPHMLQGIGAGFKPEVLNTKVYDEIIAIKDKEAFAEVKALAATEGILIGPSAGAALLAAKKIALKPETKDKNIVVLFPDSGERYLSTSLFKK